MLLDELGLFLQQQGHGTLGTTLFRGKLPLDAPGLSVADQVIALIPVPGLPPVREHGLTRFEQPVVQVLTRGAQYGEEAAFAKAQATWLSLDGLSNVVLSGVTYLWIMAMQSPYYLRVDDWGRPHVLYNLRCARAL